MAKAVVKTEKKAPPKKAAKPRVKKVVVLEPEQGQGIDEGDRLLTDKETQAKIGEGASVETKVPFKMSGLSFIKKYWPFALGGILAIVILLNTCKQKVIEKKVAANEVMAADTLAMIHAVEKAMQPLFEKVDSANNGITKTLNLTKEHGDQLTAIQEIEKVQRQEYKKLTDASIQLLKNPNRTPSQLDSMERALRSAIEQSTKVPRN